ncbi:MAG: hypothetical protein GY898_19820 [Proteobacteria bacterium]|nr:hypothetical protein [Pseudomonadota bacterium]
MNCGTALLLMLLIPVIALAQGEADESAVPDPVLPEAEPPLFPPDGAPVTIAEIPAPLPSLSAQTCNACHGEIHDQWAGSGHATAATNPVYTAAVEALGRPAECDACHLPLEVQRPTLAKGPGKGQVENPAYDPTLRLEGVTCAACHVRDGEIVGPRQLAVGQAPHPVRASRAMSTPEACVSCHQAGTDEAAHGSALIDTVGEWERSTFGQAGITCQECHMPRTSGRIAGSRYAAYSAHGLTQARDPKELARAVTLQVSLRSSSIQRGETLRATATVMNTGAAHAVPTGDPAHRLELAFTVEDFEAALPKGAEPASEWFERTLDAGPPVTVSSDSRLQPGGQRSVDYSYGADKKSKPGRYTLVVRLHWWAVSAEQAEAYGLTDEDVRILISEQRIPFDVN